MLCCCNIFGLKDDSGNFISFVILAAFAKRGVAFESSLVSKFDI